MRLSIAKDVDGIEDLVRVYAAAKEEEDAATNRRLAAQERLATAMENAREKTLVTDYSGIRIRATYSRSETPVIDGDKLKSRVGAVKYRKYCTLKPDRAKVEAALDAKELTPEDIEECVTIRQSKASIRISHVTEESEE